MNKKEELELDEISKAIDELMDKEIVLKENDKYDPNDEESMPSESLPIENNDNVVDENNMLDNYNDVSLNNANEEFNNYDDIFSKDENTVLLDKVEDDVSTNEITSIDKTERNSSSLGKLYLSYNSRLLINVFGIAIFLILGFILFVSSISIKAKSSVLYRQVSNLDYKVYLKQNDYYKEPYLNKNMRYIASLIDNVDVNFNYNFMVNQNINYKYTYYIKADVTVADSEDKTKVIYSKSDKLTDYKTVVKDNSTGFTINENIKVNYADYNDLVKAFKSSYAISASSNLVLSLHVGIEDGKGNIIKNIDSNDVMKLTVPLTEQMINISMDYNEVNNSDNARIYKDFSISNNVTLILSIISIIISIVFIVRLLLFLKKTTSKKTAYDTTLSRILREYDRVIVNSKKMVNISEDVIDVKNFNELLDVRDNLEKPIIFSEIHKGQKSVFIVRTANETYRYILKLVDLEKGEKNK